MRALQSENTSLEKELHHYQISMANKSNLSDSERQSNATTPLSLGPGNVTPRRQSIEPLDQNGINDVCSCLSLRMLKFHPNVIAGRKPPTVSATASIESKRSGSSESTNSYGPPAPKPRVTKTACRDEPPLATVQTELAGRPSSRPHSSNSSRRSEENGRYDRDIITPTGLPVRGHLVDSRSVRETLENPDLYRPHSPRAISAGDVIERHKIPRGPDYQQEFISKERISNNRGRSNEGRSRYHQSNGAYREPTAVRHVKVDQSQRRPYASDYYDPIDISVSPGSLQRPFANPQVGHSPTRTHSRERLRQDYVGPYHH